MKQREFAKYEIIEVYFWLNIILVRRYIIS